MYILVRRGAFHSDSANSYSELDIDLKDHEMIFDVGDLDLTGNRDKLK
jgi:hypothetical protein